MADAGRRSRARSRSTSRRVIPAPISTAPCVPATTCSRRRSSRSRRGPANTAGTSSRCITTSGITTRRIPSCCSTCPIDGRVRKGLAQVGKTGWAYILDRETGEPLIGIEERPVPQEPRQATAATQPYPVGDAIVPQHVEIAPEGYQLVNEGRIFTPYFGDKGMIVSPSLYGGANWPPSSYDPVRRLLFVCASDVAGNFIGGDRDFEIPPDGQHYEGGVVGFAPLPRTGIFAAVDVTTNTTRVAVSLARPVLQRLAGDGRRPRIRRPQRRPADGARLGHGTQALGVPDRRRHECAGDRVRARRQAVRRRAVGRQRADRLGEGRQRVAVRARRHAAAGGRARHRESHDGRSGAEPRRGWPRARPSRARRRGSIQGGVRRLPRRGRHGRARRRRAARPGQRSPPWS